MLYKVIVFFIVLSVSIACKKETYQTSLMGYKYQTLRQGNGPKAKVGDYAFFHVMTLVGDSLMEDTHIFPFQPALRLEVNPPQEVASIMDVMKEMSVGDSVRLIVPIDSLPFAKIEYQSYKEIHHMVVLERLENETNYNAEMDRRSKFLHRFADSLILKDSVVRATVVQHIRDYNAGNLEAKLQKTEQGVKYLLLSEGTGDIPVTGDMVEVNYTGFLTNEIFFETSFTHGQPYVYRFNTGQVIKGWDDMIGRMKEGAEAILFVPAELGYGATGLSPNIPPHSELVFYINLFKKREMRLKI
jgi:FKBP-type peptidyl-prolyl cis-trans isomerase FkpA